MKLINYTVCIYAADENSFSARKQQIQNLCIAKNIEWCPSQITSREHFFLLRPNEFIVFLDADCEPDICFFQNIEQVLSSSVFNNVCKLSKPAGCSVIVSGIYKNNNQSSYLQKVHNVISNIWIRQFYEVKMKPRCFLGGVFIVYHQLKMTKLEIHKYFKVTQLWGGEEKMLSQVLINNPFNFEFHLNTNLAVTHLTRSGLKHFLRRAWLHGKNEIYLLDFDKEYKEKSRVKKIVFNLNLLNYWIQNIPWGLSVGVFLHFLIQRVAKIFQIFGQSYKQKKLKSANEI